MKTTASRPSRAGLGCYAWLVLVGVLVLGWSAQASAQATMLSGFGGAAGYGTNVVAKGDDNSTGFINVGSAFPAQINYFGARYSGFYINVNGNITFGGAVSTYTPVAFPVSNLRMIAPWWGDVDTRGSSSSIDNDIYWHIDAAGRRVIVTWNQVGYYNSKVNKWNNFQMILRDRSDVIAGDFDVEYRYNRCEWTTGDAFSSGGSNGLGGIPAQAGFDAGDGVNFLTLPGSRTAAVLNLCTTSNVGEPGVWRFTVRNGGVSACGNGFREQGEACDDGNSNNNDGCNALCQIETDTDGDGIYDPYDNCVTTVNPTQANQDGDAFGDACDVCPLDANNDQDGDGVCGNVDNCPTIFNPDQANLDGDSLGDACDNDVDGDGSPAGVDCNDRDAGVQSNRTYWADADGDGWGASPSTSVCSSTPPAGYVANNTDNCPTVFNPDQANLDGDALGDACDNDVDGDGRTADVDCNDRDASVWNLLVSYRDQDSDGFGDPGQPTTTCSVVPPGGYVTNNTDNCPNAFNPDQANLDGDGLGDACDNDVDGDGRNADVDCNDRDASVWNTLTSYRDQDADGFGDATQPSTTCSLTPATGFVLNGTDNCPNTFNPDQANLDGDGLGDACDNDVDGDGRSADIDCNDRDASVWNTLTSYRDVDADGFGDPTDPTTTCSLTPPAGFVTTTPDNCPTVFNPDQADLDGDGMGDVCDDDADGDGVPNDEDCDPLNPDVVVDATFYFDGDGDGWGVEDETLEGCQATPPPGWVRDAPDNCPDIFNADQADLDGDGVGDACDPDIDGDGILDDGDGDGIPGNNPCRTGTFYNCDDNCRYIPNFEQTDTDGDGRGDACGDDADGDGIPDDGDGDGVGETPCMPGESLVCDDNCPLAANPGQEDQDGDGVGDACDPDQDGDGIPDDGNGDGVPGSLPCRLGGAERCDDNCPTIPNADQADLDGDGIGDACDDDADGDGFPDAPDPDLPPCTGGETVACTDNCPDIANPSQADTDGDGIGDACDDDTDGDGVPNDGDGDGNPGNNPCTAGNTVGCDDNCPFTDNPDQADEDGDGVGDACEGDQDGDGVLDDADGTGTPGDGACTGGETLECDDNCPLVPNPDQADDDMDGIGNACDPDWDNDDVPNDGNGDGTVGNTPCTGRIQTRCDDNCPTTWNPDQMDQDGDGIGDACDDDADGDGVPDDNGPPCAGGAVTDCSDNCPGLNNPSQRDQDGDGVGDACDACPIAFGPADLAGCPDPDAVGDTGIGNDTGGGNSDVGLPGADAEFLDTSLSDDLGGNGDTTADGTGSNPPTSRLNGNSRSECAATQAPLASWLPFLVLALVASRRRRHAA